MSDTPKKPQRLDKNGRPYPAHKTTKPAAKGKPATSAKPKRSAPKQTGPVGTTHPMDWLFLHREPYSVEQLKKIFTAVPDLDVEVWPALQISELTFPNKVFMDFEYTPEPPQEPELLALLEREQIQTVYYVSVEPFCSDPELDFLRHIAQETGGIMVADNDDLSPVLR